MTQYQEKKLTLFSSTGQTVSVESGQVVDFAKALEYPSSPVPLSLANPDGSHRVTSKSKLLKVILKHCNSQILYPRESQPTRQVVGAVVIDMMACLRTMTQIPDTYEELTWKFLKLLPQAYEQIDIVANTYHEVSLKSAERSQREKASKVISFVLPSPRFLEISAIFLRMELREQEKAYHLNERHDY